jgi:hypothetical protein
MAEKKKFLLRVLYSALEKWAADDLRSINSQMEFLLTDAARKSGRLKRSTTARPDDLSPEQS